MPWRLVIASPRRAAALTSYYLPDAQGTIRALAGPGGVTDRYTYDAYGQTRDHTGSAINPFGFTGAQTDAGTDLINLRARNYDPAMGRFLSRDTFAAPHGLVAELNRYGYAQQNPVTLTDPTGHSASAEAFSLGIRSSTSKFRASSRRISHSSRRCCATMLSRRAVWLS